jgi:large subunit ribosomal protein L21
MLMTVLEIVAYMAAAAIVGVLLGWVLRGVLGNEQAEISAMRSQLRQLKKANREGKATDKPTQADKVSNASVALKSEQTSTTTSPTSKAPEKKADTPVTRAKTSTPVKTPAKAAKKPSKRKSLAEREADQAAGASAFVAVIERIGKDQRQDKLTKIYGVGKKYESMLNDLGVSSYQQVSKLKKAEVRTLAAALGVLDDRLDTEDWVGGAKTLLKQAK